MEQTRQFLHLLRPPAVLLLAAAATVSAVQAERPHVFAIRGATIVTAPGERIDGGTLILRDGLIEAVGADLAVPADAQLVDGDGLWLYPGLIDALTHAGLPSESPGESRGSAPGGGPPFGGAGAGREPAGAVHALSLVRPERRARDELKPFAESDGDAKRYREQGFTAVLVAPKSGIFRGRSVVVQLRDATPVRELILRDDVLQHVGFSRARFGRGYPTSLMGATAAIRQTLLDARRHALWSGRYAADPGGMPRPETNAAFEALAPVVAGEQPVLLAAESPDDTLLALRLAGEFDLDPIVAGSGHEWEIAGRLRGVRLIHPVAFPDKPKVDEDLDALEVSSRDLRRYLEAPAGPGRLHEAGATLALTTNGLKNMADLPKQMRKIIDAGLAPEAALAAWTTTPASLLGVDRLIGTLAPGKIANVLVTDGELFAEATKIKEIYVDGRRHKMKEKSKPKGDPDAVVDPRGEWSVVFEFGSRSITRAWTIEGRTGAYTGTAETREGTVEFDSVTLEGNVMTVVIPAQGPRGATEISVVIEGESFKGDVEMGPRSFPIRGSRTSGPQGGAR